MSAFQPLNQKIGLPGVDIGGVDGSVLFDSLSTSKTSPSVYVGPHPVVLKAYNLQTGESVAVNNRYNETGATSPYTRDSNPVALDPSNSTVVLYLAGYYELEFTGTLGQLIVTATKLDGGRHPNSNNTAGMLRSDTAWPNPLLYTSELLSPKVLIGPRPYVYRAYGLSTGESVTILNIFSKQGVDYAEPFSRNGAPVTLTPENNTVVLDIAGMYQFQVAAAIPGLMVVGHETAVGFVDPYLQDVTEAAANHAADSAAAAAASEAAAGTSETNAAASEAAAATSETNAAASEAAAATSETNAAASEAAAATSETNAAASEAAAGTSETNAAASEAAAATSETNAAASASSASTDAATANTAATNASGSSTAAATSATGAATSATNAANSATAAAASAAGARLHGVATITSNAGVVTLDLAQNIEQYNLTLSENVTSWVFNNLPDASHVVRVVVALTQDATARSCVSPASSGRTAGGPWTVSSTAGAMEYLHLNVDNSGKVKLFAEGPLA